MHPARPFTHSRGEQGVRRKSRKRRGLLRRTLGMLWHHPLLTGAVLAATGWLLNGDHARAPRVRRVAGQAVPVTDLPAEGVPGHG